MNGPTRSRLACAGGESPASQRAPRRSRFALALALAAGCSDGPIDPDAEPDAMATLAAAEPHYVRGLLAGRDLDFVAARYHWLQAVRINPDYSLSHWQRELTWFDPDNSACANPYDARSWFLYARDDRDGVLADLVAAAHTDPTLLTEWNRTTVADEDLGAAIAHLNAAIQANPRGALAWFQRGVAWSAMGNDSRAIEDHATAMRLDPAFSLPYLARGCIHLREARLARAAKDFHAAVERDPENPFAYAQRGWSRYLLGDFQAAVDDLSEALRLGPDDPGRRSRRGLALFELGRSDEALNDFERSHAGDPRRLFDHHPAREDDLEALAARYAQRSAGAPDDAAAVFLLGNVLRDDARREDALVAYAQALELRPDFALARVHRGKVWQELGRDDRALADFTAAIEIDARAARALNNRGNIYFERGDTARAHADYEAAIAARPLFPWPYRNLGTLVSERDPQRAVQLLTWAVHLDRQYGAAYESRAAIHAALGNIAAAKNDRRLARLSSP